MLECVINLSEGRQDDLIAKIAACGGPSTLDVHSDPFHNRSVVTLGGPDVVEAAIALTRCAAELLDLTDHRGVHPRIGAIDVVPFIPLEAPLASGDVDLSEALSARRIFATTVATEFDLPCFFYGPERSLPEVRRAAFRTLAPDIGPVLQHPRLGGCCVGARPVLIAYNCLMRDRDIARAQHVASALRSAALRCLAFEVGEAVQISCNLTAPWQIGPAEVFDAISQHMAIDYTELVGLIPQWLLERTPETRWMQLDLAPDRTIESRLGRPLS